MELRDLKLDAVPRELEQRMIKFGNKELVRRTRELSTQLKHATQAIFHFQYIPFSSHLSR